MADRLRRLLLHLLSLLTLALLILPFATGYALGWQQPQAGSTALISIASGQGHTLALQGDGTVWTWGYNYYGQLGDGTYTDRSTPAQVAGLSDVVAVAAGAYHCVALKSDGTVWAWGSNNRGQLGDGTTINRTTPVQVAGLSGITAVTAGTSYTVVLKNDGTVWGLGYNADGELGDGTTTSSAVPVQAANLSGVTAIAAGGYYFTVALKEDGTVWTWGDNFWGQLGDGTIWDRHVPGVVPGLTGVTAIAPGYLSVEVLKGDGTVWGWGYNLYGQLGDGTQSDRYTPVQVSGMSGVSALAAGYYHTLALKSDGSVWSWGKNSAGQLGDGSDANRYLPVRVAETSGVTAIGAGGNQSFDVSGDNRAWSWGYNLTGQLGDGTTVNRYTRTLIPGIGTPLAPVATISGPPPYTTNATSASYAIGGAGVGWYRYRLDAAPYSGDTPVYTPLTLDSLTEGTHIISVIGGDDVGNWQQVPTVTSLNIDLTAPVATVTGAPASPTNATTVTLTIGGTDVAAYKYKVDDGGYSGENTSSQLRLTGLGDGTHTVSVIGRDSAGNWQVTPTAVSFTVDSTPPVTTPSPGTGYVSAGATVTLACSDGAGTGCSATRYCLGTGCTPGTTYTGPIAISTRTDLRFYSTDALGNAETVKTASYSLLAADYAVTVTVSGSGTGTVTSDPAGISTSGSTSARFAGGSTVTLHATPGDFSLFSGWSGSCSGSGDCVLTMTGDRSTTATFAFDSAHSTFLPASGAYYPTIQSAYDASADGGVISLWGTVYNEAVVLGTDKNVAINGGYDQGYSTQAGATILHGSLRISRGSVTIDRMSFR